MVQKSSILQTMVIIQSEARLHIKPLTSYNGPLIGHDPTGSLDSLKHIVREKRTNQKLNSPSYSIEKTETLEPAKKWVQLHTLYTTSCDRVYEHL